MEIKEYSTKEYWDRRTQKYKNDPQALLFRDPRFKEYEKRAFETLFHWRELKVADIACGYGRMANIFLPDRYTGYDFSKEMIKLAQEKNPKYRFVCCDDVKRLNSMPRFDVVFEVNSLHCLGMTPQEFFEEYRDRACGAIACLEADCFTVFQIY